VCKGRLPVGPGVDRPAKSLSQLARFYAGLAHGFVHTCLHEKGKDKAVEKVMEAEPHDRPATWLGQSATTW
jgi:hypothetical protein